MRNVLKRLLHLLLVLFVVSLGTMLLLDIVPGDPVTAVLGENATDEQVEALRSDLDLDKPFHVRYASWISSAVSGDLGRSIQTNAPVWTSLKERLPVTAEIAVLSMGFALVVAIPLGMVAADREGKAVDRATGFVASTVVAVPPFLSAILLLFFFSVTFRIFPVSGWVPLTENVWENLRHVALPVIVTGGVEAASLTRILRGDMVETLSQDFILTARSLGVPRWRVLLRHALRPSSFTLLTLSGIHIGRLIGGTIIVEQIFALPGIGQMIISAITYKDFVVIQGVVLFTASVYVILNMGVTLGYAWLDPRTKVDGTRGH